MINPGDLDGVPERTARRILAVARSIAPCLNNLEGEARQDAIDIILDVVEELPATGTSRVRSQSRNGTTVSFADVRSAFDSDARAALRNLCGAATLATSAAPVGNFPPAGMVTGLWPEEEFRR